MNPRAAFRFSVLLLAVVASLPALETRAAGAWTSGRARPAAARELSAAVPAAATTAGALQFTLSGSGFTLLNGSVSINVSRVGGSTGAVSVTAASKDGTALAGVDYTATTTTLSWADGDSADKIFTIPIINRNLPPGTTLDFDMVLSNPTGGAALGATPIVDYTIRYDATVPQPTVDITSPPADVTLVSGTSITLSAVVDDPGNILSGVQFFLNGAPAGKSTSEGPFMLTTTVPAPGSYELQVVVTDNQGRTSQSSRLVTVVAPDPANPAPSAALYTAVGGRTLAGGSTVVLTADAQSLSADGSPLASVQFFADNTLIAAYDGAGNLLSGSSGEGIGPGGADRRAASERRLADSTGGGATRGTVFTAAWSIPNLSKLINLLTVATTASGQSQVSPVAAVQAVATSATSNHPPSAVIKSVGHRVRTGSAITVPVTVTDPDAGGSTSAEPGGSRTAGVRRNTLGVPGSVISSVDFYLNQLKVATATQPPYAIAFTPPSDGTYVLEAIATDDAGLSGVAVPLVVDAVSTTPTVTISLPGGVNAFSAPAGAKVKATITRAGDDLSEPLTVTYKPKGTAVSGVNYKTLTGSVTIPAGAASTKLQVKTLNDGVTGQTVLSIKVAADPNGVYTPGASSGAKIRIQD